MNSPPELRAADECEYMCGALKGHGQVISVCSVNKEMLGTYAEGKNRDPGQDHHSKQEVLVFGDEDRLVR